MEVTNFYIENLQKPKFKLVFIVFFYKKEYNDKNNKGDKMENGIDDVRKNKKIIVKFSEKEKIIHASLYQFLDLYSGYLSVYHMTEEEFASREKQIEKDIFMENNIIDNNRPLMVSTPQGSIYIIDSNENNGSFYLSRNQELQIYYNDKFSSLEKDNLCKQAQGIKIYTTENYEDIIKNYFMNSNISLEEIESKISKTI